MVRKNQKIENPTFRIAHTIIVSSLLSSSQRRRLLSPLLGTYKQTIASLFAHHRLHGFKQEEDAHHHYQFVANVVVVERQHNVVIVVLWTPIDPVEEWPSFGHVGIVDRDHVRIECHQFRCVTTRRS